MAQRSHKAVIFDFDGTLADTFPLVMQVCAELTHMQPLTDAEAAVLRPLPLLQAITTRHTSRLQIPRLILSTRRKMRSRVASEVPLFDGVPELIRALHAEGYQLFVLSSNLKRNVNALLEAHDLRKYFSGVYHCNVFNKAVALRLLVWRNHLDKAESYYVGNEPLDAHAARIVGVKHVAVTWSGTNPIILQHEQPLAIVGTPTAVLEVITK